MDLRMKTKYVLSVYLLAAILTVILALVVFYGIQNRRLNAQLNQQKLELAKFHTEIAKDGAIIATQEQNILTLREARNQLEYDLKQLKEKGIKDATTIVWLNTEVERLKVFANYIPDTIIDTIVIQKEADLLTYLRVPRPFKFEDQWLLVNGTVKTTGVLFDSIVTYNQPSIVIGTDKRFFKKPIPIVVYEDKNPYSKVLNMNNIIIQNKPPFYKTPMFYRLEGALLLYGVSKGITMLQ